MQESHNCTTDSKLEHESALGLYYMSDYLNICFVCFVDFENANESAYVYGHSNSLKEILDYSF